MSSLYIVTIVLITHFTFVSSYDTMEPCIGSNHHRDHLDRLSQCGAVWDHMQLSETI